MSLTAYLKKRLIDLLEEKRVVAGKSYSPEGTILTSEGPGKPWTFVDRLGPIYTHDRVVTIPGERGVIASKSAAIQETTRVA